MKAKRDLKGSSLSELQAFVEEFGEKKFRAAQIYGWLYAKAAQSFDEMTDVSKEFRLVLKQTSQISNLHVVTKKISSDGTTKFLFKLQDGLAVESVLIPSVKKKLRRGKPIDPLCFHSGWLPA
jgi:23S rRNA (adenine2503-C2)-methyltransferase